MLTEYYQKSKNRLQKMTLKRYQNLSGKENNKKRQHACERCRNLSEEEKTKSVNMVMDNIEIFWKMKSQC